MFRSLFKRSQEGPPLAFSFVWLVYLAFPIGDLIERPLQEQMVGFPILFLFAVIYVVGYVRPKVRLFAIFVLFALIVYYSFRYDPGYLYLTFYPSPMIGMLRDSRQLAAAIAGMLAVFAAVIWHAALWNDSYGLLQLAPAMLIMLMMPFLMRFGRRSRELKDKLVLANEEIARLSKNEERERISRDLHDTLGHTLSLITLKSELAEKLIAKNPERAAQEIRDVQMTSRAALRQVRELVSGMSAVTVRDEISHAKQILAAAGIELELDAKTGADENVPAPAPLVDNLLGMCLREAVTNVVKHSRARSCAIGWGETPHGYLLTVKDDGIGAASAALAGDGMKNGIQGMRNRLRLVDGEVTVTSAAGKGTEVRITVPRVEKNTGKESAVQ